MESAKTKRLNLKTPFHELNFFRPTLLRMKRCPECRRDYYDERLLYCLDDGFALLEGPARSDELPTEVIPAFNSYGDRRPLPRMDAFEIAKGASTAIAVLP